MSVAEVCDECIKDVRNPGCEHRRRTCIDGKGGADGLQEDVGERERQSDTEVQTHAARALARRQRDTDDGEDKGCKRRGDALMVFHFVLHNV